VLPTLAWEIEPGDKLRRVELHDRYGGGRQGGIAGSRTTPNVLIFSDPASGEQHGYFDQWANDDEFHYAGEGQHGDQALDRGNAAILNHRDEGRALRVFWGSKGSVEYAGEFEIDEKRSVLLGRRTRDQRRTPSARDHVPSPPGRRSHNR